MAVNAASTTLTFPYDLETITVEVVPHIHTAVDGGLSTSYLTTTHTLEGGNSSSVNATDIDRLTWSYGTTAL
ncbi:hypothetical protein LTR10_003016 [Elasticomyces elasticus]|nr:hypothetical protein LTR10_003016 [Elasticomyces elasticus]KAK4967646.1 hypothetical protein LTR42_009971 [Elasticomyces elasticus]